MAICLAVSCVGNNMKTLLIDNGSKYFENLKSILSINRTNEITIVDYSEITNPRDGNYDLAVISGGHHKVINHTDDIYKDEIELILHGKTPVLGICLGCELIAFANGASLNPLSQKEENFMEIFPVTNDLIFQGVINPIQVYESHKYSVSDLPPQLLELAKSKDGPEIIKHVSKPIYGFQFHPELNPENLNTYKLFTNTVNQLLTYDSQT